MTDITYANAHACVPANRTRLRVIDLNTGQEVTAVIDVNTVEGWLRRYTGEITGEIAEVECVEGRFRIEGVEDAA